MGGIQTLIALQTEATSTVHATLKFCAQNASPLVCKPDMSQHSQMLPNGCELKGWGMFPTVL
jgi:hypothetical protein